MKLSRTVGQSLQIGKVFPAGGINAMDFSPNGETLVTSSSDDSISVYLCKPGMYVPLSSLSRSRSRSRSLSPSLSLPHSFPFLAAPRELS